MQTSYYTIKIYALLLLSVLLLTLVGYYIQSIAAFALTCLSRQPVWRFTLACKHLGDVIIAVDGHNVNKSDDIINYVGQHKIAGDNITLTVYRNGHAIDLKATLTARPSLIPFLTTRLAMPSIPHLPLRPPTIPIPHP
jgi:PDZ domain